MSNETLRDTFFAECEELIESLTEGLQVVASGAWDGETINAIFRAVHSIKGAAGAFGFTDLVTFAHAYETVLDLIRSDKLDIAPDVLRLITRSSDALAELVDTTRQQGSASLDPVRDLIGELEATAKDAKADTPPEPEFTWAPLALLPIEVEAPAPAQGFTIRFAPGASFYANGHEPVRFLSALDALGNLTVTCDSSAVPPLDGFDFDAGYLVWTLTLEGASDEEAIRRVFAFAEGLCTLDIAPLGDSTAPDLPEVEVEAAPLFIARAPAVDPPADPPADAPVTPAAAPPARAAAPRAPAPPVQTTLRVDPERVDRLINSVGELIINHAVISQKLESCGLGTDSEIMAALDDYRYLAREIQEAVMSIRAQPVKALFQRMGRVVREAGEATGKAVMFISEGEATEIDKTILERLADPLTHMLRNSVDHGLETAEKRRAAGKSEVGSVRLSAAHRSGHVVIEVSDDGAGLNRERILAKAMEKGLVPPDAKLTEPEIDNLLFMPGFSTAENVTNLSGRGVGMDVVKTTITSLGGKVGITSLAGEGSTFTISLPLTLAVLDGMIIGVGAETMVLPLSSVVETVRPQRRDIHEIAGELVLSVRGTYVPIVDLALLFGMRSAKGQSAERSYVLLDAGGASIAVAVDAIQDQRQVVIKSLEGNYGTVPGIAAATILGDGKIALIIDSEALVELVSPRRNARPLIELEA
ncbi:chemotaxis protein CheA [Pararhodobacter aggregans]|uniref:Chemotaxis protein CheA n=1 Tax=Pararhodobacter aggregans TaxID=404875 RepID=A0A2T7US90_9RHOB|nr:chemotaxis protein CheA [Pararhodobacter aggregans]PTX00198.1 two-component system chemotaxis sensor kinase CheA [Pararhodobacter aggregans]PVE47524.1 chemotaxis protein CheA [Pararhodobacter aggregans]